MALDGSSDYIRSTWGGSGGHAHDFGAARRVYEARADVSSREAVRMGVTQSDVLPRGIMTQSKHPFVLAVDITGSMHKKPAIIYAKTPHLENEARVYLGDDVEICIGAVGDIFARDKYPLQARPFSAGLAIKEQIDKLVLEKDMGGGTKHENYEHMALYIERNISMPNAITPIVVFTGDEVPYDFVDPDTAKSRIYIDLKERITTEEIFARLKDKAAVYMIKYPYNQESHRSDSDRMSDTDKWMYERWAGLVGEDHLSYLVDPERVVDTMFGIFAKETGKIPYFREELRGRQTPAQIAAAEKSLVTIHANMVRKDPSVHSGRSILWNL